MGPHNEIVELLTSLSVVEPDQLEVLAPRVRDRDDVQVLRCRQSGVILLSRSDHIDMASTYSDADLEGTVVDGTRRHLPRLPDAIRRAKDFGDLIQGKRWLDFGAGSGGTLCELSSRATEAVGVEPNAGRRSAAVSNGLRVVRQLGDLDASEQFDVITLFHVLEHLVNPVDMLCQLRGRLGDGGRLVLEVPHAADALMTLFDSEAFRRFTFWSQHLVLHTRQSLRAVIRAAGFTEVEIRGYQRYSVANHLHWLRHGRPGGHETWKFLDTPELETAYEHTLQRIDRTDTLVAYVSI